MKANHFSPDTLEFFSLLFQNQIRYLIVGGEAVIYHGFARLTGDVDIFYDATEENINRLYTALQKFWDGDIPGLERKTELAEPGIIFQFGVPPNRIDLLNTITNVDFEGAWNNRITENMKDKSRSFDIYYIGLEELIRNKQNMGRYKDLEDLRYLQKIKT